MDDEVESQSSRQDIVSGEQLGFLDSSSSYRASSESNSEEIGEDNDYKYLELLRGHKVVSKRHHRIYGNDWAGENVIHQAKHSRNWNNNIKKKLQNSKSRSKPASYRQRSTTPNVVKSTAESVRRPYNDNYRQLLNDSISDATATAEPKVFPPLNRGQIGATTWSSNEKEAFFSALSRLGRDDIRGIASRIGSKSEIEVQEYIGLLQCMIGKSPGGPRWHLSGLTEFPIALQISPECCDMLEMAADALAIRQNRHEDHVEETKWGDYWLLTQDVSRQIEEMLRDGGGEDDLKELCPATTLLNLRNWLDLSTKIFMNPAATGEAENWRSLVDTEADEMPAIRATAFEDFYHLTISLTRRLVSATIFCTMSRLRATQPGHFKRSEIVRRADVEAAINSLGLDADSQKFWIDCPRRCNLEVYLHKSSTTKQRLIGYDELEILLAQGNDPSDQATQSTDVDKVINSDSRDRGFSPSDDTVQSTCTETEVDGSSQSEAITRDLAAEYTANFEQEFVGLINLSESEIEHPNKYQERVLKKARLKEETECAQHKYAEIFDVRASLLEEKMLWELLNQDAPFKIEADDIKLPEKPTNSKEGAGEVIDWRDGLEFCNPWETSNGLVPATKFSASSKRRRKRRASKTQVKTNQASSEASMDMAGENFGNENQVLAAEMSIEEMGNDVFEGDEGSETSVRSNSEVRQRTMLQNSSPGQADAQPRSSRNSSISDFDPSILPGFTDVMRARLREHADGDQVCPPCDQCRTLSVACLKASKRICASCQNTNQKRCSWVNATEEEVFVK